GWWMLAAAAVLVIGSITWTEHVLDWNSGLGRLLLPGAILSTARHPGRPSALTCFCFILIGLELLLLPARRRLLANLRDFTAIANITLAYFALVWYLLRPDTRGAEIMSPTAAAFVLLISVGVLLTGSEGSLKTLLNDPGPAGIIARRLLPVPFALP